MTNPFRKIEEWQDTEGHEKNKWGEYDWPYPTEYIKSIIEDGPLKDAILTKHGIPDRDFDELYIIESNVSCGWSEYTQENDYAISVWIAYPNGQRNRLFKTHLCWSETNALNNFIREYPFKKDE